MRDFVLPALILSLLGVAYVAWMNPSDFIPLYFFFTAP